MKQLTLSSVIGAMSDEPKTIGERLASLGVNQEVYQKHFSADILGIVVYGSSFLKFLQDNAKLLAFDEEIPAQVLPVDFKNPFNEQLHKVGERLDALNIGDKEAKAMFGDDVLNLSVTGAEFQNFLIQNQDKFFQALDKLVGKGAKHV